MRALAFTGLPGSGKSEAVEIARGRGLPVLRMGDLVFEETRRRGHPLEDAHVGRVANEMRTQHGPDVWAARTLERLGKPPYTGAPLVVIDGVRSLEEVEAFRRGLGRSFVLAAVVAPETVRHERVLARGRSDDHAQVEGARARDEREKAWGIERAIRAADVTIANDGALDRFRRSVEELLARETAAARP